MKKYSKKITTITILLLLTSFPQKVQAAARATGGTYTESGGYGIHTFTNSGTFTPGNSMNVEYLVVAGGGGGGQGGAAVEGGGGGGGAGGLKTATGYSVAAQGYTVTVGGGGAKNTNGGNSVFSAITSTGGGGGGIANNNDGSGGGSGGGGAGGVSSSTGGSGGSGTPGQGYDGGSASDRIGGGGGGGGAIGTTNDGGAGVSSSISGSSLYYAGGGGGGAGAGTPGIGGSSIGGNGANDNLSDATAGATNTGSGGGGGSDNSNYLAGSGGSGIVIIKYILAVPPTAPTIGTATVLSNSSIQWNFTDNASDETGFKVYDTSNVLKTTCASANISSCAETGLTGNTSYTRKIVAYNGDGNSDYSATDTASTNSSCFPTLGDATHSINEDCGFSGYTDASSGTRIVSGLDSGTGATNTSVLTISSGVLTINANESLVIGSIELTGGSIAIAEGANMMPGSSLWGIDKDGDGYPETTTFHAQISSPTDGVRLNTIAANIGIADCDDTDIGTNTTCCTQETLFEDLDGDGYGTNTSSIFACPQSGYATNNVDCNDTGTNSQNVYVSASCYTDADNDNYGSTTAISCTDNATCGSATWGSNGAGTTANSGNFASNNTDCNNSNASKYVNNWVTDTCYDTCCDTHSWSGGTCGNCASGPFAGCSSYTVTDGCTCKYSGNNYNCNAHSCNGRWECGN